MKVERTKAGDAVSELLLTTFRLNGAFLGAADRISAPFDLTAARWQVLGTVMPADKTVSQIAREMGLSRQSVQRLSNVLEGEGKIAFLDNPAHQRAKLVSPTEAGRATMKALSETQHIWANETSEGISAEDIRDALGVMRAVIVRLEGADRL